MYKFVISINALNFMKDVRCDKSKSNSLTTDSISKNIVFG